MTSLIKKWTSLVLVVALIVTMAPLGWTPKVSADSIYFQFDNLSTDMNSPVEVITDRINISGSFSGVSPTSITYRVERLTDDGDLIESTVGTATPIISNNDSTFLFVGVQIFEGLNRIVVTGINASSNQVEGEGYVYFANSPIISKVSLSDGRTLVAGTPRIVGTSNPGIIVNATNAAEVTINGIAAYSGSSGTYITTSVTLQPGYNQLQIVASNNGKTYTVTRELVYYSGSPTAFDMKAGTISLDGNPTVNLAGDMKISGKLAFPKPNPMPATYDPPEISLEIWVGGVNVLNIPAADITVDAADTSDNNYIVFPFETNDDLSFGTNPLGQGNYVIRVKSNAWEGSKAADSPVTFTNLDTSTAVYITKIWRLYGVNANTPGAVTSTGRTQFTDNATVNSLPLWLMLETANNIPAENDTTVTAYVDGAKIAWDDYDAGYLSDNYKLGSNGYRIVKVENLPVGEVTLEFSVGTPLTTSVTLNYEAIPQIRITNLYNGQKFTSANGLTAINVSLVNFSPADYGTIGITINGEEQSVTTPTQPDFTHAVNTPLVPGPNTIIVSGRAWGVPISTTITVYYFSDDEPKIYNILPVPKDEAGDPDGLIERQGSSNQYLTEESEIDILFTAEDFDSLHVSEDGTNTVNMTIVAGTPPTTTIDDPNRLEIVGSSGSTYELRYKVSPLPAVGGARSVTFSLKRGAVTVMHTVTVTRVVPAYRVLSPKLPEEQVVKQNYLDVVIYAPGADRVELGKEVMTEDSLNPYYFKRRVTGLKVGKNTLKFTVYRGTQSVNGQFDVTYAADYKVGAQYVTELPSSGKISVFGGNLQLTFPKNTYLKPALPAVQADSLFTSQSILFGIADKDGRTIKTVNNNGTITEIPTDTTARNLLAPESHFGFASQLYWIDPGYVDVTTNLNNYTFVDGDHPYATGNKFYDRNDPAKWLKPTQRGTITIKYDEALRNEAASNLSIWRFDGTTWINLGGKVDTNKKTVTTTIDEFGFFAVMILRYSYNDIIGHDYARNALELMFARGIMDRKNANEFGVYDNITRGEFAQMLVKMLNLELDYDDNNLTFDDVPALKLPNTLWDYRYIETAVRKGIVRGRGPRLFLPNEPLTREEAAVMIARATNLLKGKEDPEKDQEQLKKQFTDGGLISYYAASSVLAIYKAGFITGAPNGTAGNGKPTYRFDPHANLKRADAAVIAERVMRKNKLL
jgi:hypothetical protein